jgi:hypothetical protein
VDGKISIQSKAELTASHLEKEECAREADIELSATFL